MGMFGCLYPPEAGNDPSATDSEKRSNLDVLLRVSTSGSALVCAACSDTSPNSAPPSRLEPSGHAISRTQLGARVTRSRTRWQLKFGPAAVNLGRTVNSAQELSE